MFCNKQKKPTELKDFKPILLMSSEYCLKEEWSSQSSEQKNVTSIYNYAVITQHPLHLSTKPGKSLKTLLQMERKWDRLKTKTKQKKPTAPFWFHLNCVYAQTIQSYEGILLTSQTLNQKANDSIIFMCISDQRCYRLSYNFINPYAF